VNAVTTAKRDLLAAVHSYDEAWAETDSEHRRALLQAVWADDGVYVDPEVPRGVCGPQALAGFIESSRAQYPGLEIVATSELAVLGDRAWYSWKASTSAGESFTGVDFFEFASDGRVARVTNFYDQ
jgi:hypothetical protein